MRRFLRPLLLAAAVLVVLGLVAAVIGGNRLAVTLAALLALLLALAVLR